MLSWPPKDPDEVLDYQIGWSSRLATNEHISASLWIPYTDNPAGITTSDEANTTTITTIWLEGGTEGATYKFTNRITTDASPKPRVMDQSVSIKVKTR